MKKLVILVAVAVAAVLGGKVVWQKYQEKDAIDFSRTRVEATLSGLKSGGAGEQDALGYWVKDSPVLTEDEVRSHIDRFEGFLAAQDVRTIESYRVEGVELVGEGKELKARVRCTINGKNLTMIVRKGRPIAWAD